MDIYEKSGDAGHRLLLGPDAALPDFADPAEWFYVGTHENVRPDLAETIRREGYVRVTGREDAPLETDWEGVYGADAAPPGAVDSQAAVPRRDTPAATRAELAHRADMEPGAELAAGPDLLAAMRATPLQAIGVALGLGILFAVLVGRT